MSKLVLFSVIIAYILVSSASANQNLTSSILSTSQSEENFSTAKPCKPKVSYEGDELGYSGPNDPAYSVYNENLCCDGTFTYGIFFEGWPPGTRFELRLTNHNGRSVVFEDSADLSGFATLTYTPTECGSFVLMPTVYAHGFPPRHLYDCAALIICEGSCDE